MIGAAHPHRGAHQQREDADAGERDVESEGTAGDWRDGDVDHLPRSLAQQHVMQRPSFDARVQRRGHVVDPVDRLAIDREQDVARLHAGAPGRGIGRDFGGDDVGAVHLPEDAVLRRPGGRDVLVRRHPRPVGPAEARPGGGVDGGGGHGGPEEQEK